MKRALTLLIFLSLMALPAASQGANVGRVQEITLGLSQMSELPNNIRLRFEIMSQRIGDLERADTAPAYMEFYNDTRVMVWNRQVSTTVEQSMVALEEQLVGIGALYGITPDREPVGYSKAAAERLNTAKRLSSEGVHNISLSAEQACTEVLSRRDSAEVLFLRNDLVRLREDTADRNISTALVRSVLGARARVLLTDLIIEEPALLEQLNQLAEHLRGTFTPEVLRAGGHLSL